MSFVHSARMTLYTTPNQYSPLWVTWELNSSECAGDRSYLLCHVDFNVLSTFWKFQQCKTQDNFSTLRVTWELDFSESGGHNSYLLIYDNFDVLTTFCRFSLLRRRAKFHHYGSLNSSIFQKLLGTDEIAAFVKISISAGHSASVRPVQHKTSFFSHEWREATHTSCFTMTFMSFVHSGSLSLVRRPTSFLCCEWRENSTFQRVVETTYNFCFTMIFDVSSTFFQV